MKFTLSSQALNSRLSILARVINPKNSLPILDCFLMEIRENALFVTASDSENVMQCRLDLEYSEGEGRFAVPNRTLLDAVKELPEQPLTFDVNTESYAIKVVYQNGHYNFTGERADDYPVFKQVEDGAKIVMPATSLVNGISRTLFATANDDLRPVMNGVYFDITDNGVVLVASDGHKLVRSTHYVDVDQNATSFILPKKPATLLKTVIAKSDEDVTICFNDRNADVFFANGMLSCRLIEGRYPNYNAVIPQGNPNTLTIDRRSLIGALRRVLPFASESSQLVRFEVGDGRLVLSSEDIDFATSAKEELVCDYAGSPMSIGFKGPVMQEVLSNIESEEVHVELADPSRAGIVLPAEQPQGEHVLMLIMPMLLND